MFWSCLATFAVTDRILEAAWLPNSTCTPVHFYNNKWTLWFLTFCSVLGSKLQAPVDTPSADLFAELNWMTFPERVKYQKAVLMFKITNNLTPSYLNNLYSYTSDIHQRSLRTIDNPKQKSSEIHFPILDLWCGMPSLNLLNKVLLWLCLKQKICSGLMPKLNYTCNDMYVHEFVPWDVWAHLLIFCHFDRENSLCDFLFCFLGRHNPPKLGCVVGGKNLLLEVQILSSTDLTPWKG